MHGDMPASSLLRRLRSSHIILKGKLLLSTIDVTTDVVVHQTHSAEKIAS